jgi:hypothetical protein
MVKVYFETDGYVELVAIFATESNYMVCLPILELEAIKQGFMRVTESIEL